MKSLRRAILILFIFSWSGWAQAQAIAAAGMGVSLDTASDGRSGDAHAPFSLRAGYRLPEVDLFAEYNVYRASNGGSTLYVSRLHQESLIWARHLLYSHAVVSPYAALGAGVQWDVIDTTFSESSRATPDLSRETGEPQALLAGLAGVRWQITETVDTQVEGRVSNGASATPNLLIGFGMYLGVRF